MEDFKNKKNMSNNGMKNTSGKGSNPQSQHKQMPGEHHENKEKHTEGQGKYSGNREKYSEGKEKYPSHMEKSYSSSKSGDICKGCNCRKSECECCGK